MSIGIAFWIILLVYILHGLYQNRTAGPLAIGGNVVLWLLLVLLGWRTFGPAIHP